MGSNSVPNDLVLYPYSTLFECLHPYSLWQDGACFLQDYIWIVNKPATDKKLVIQTTILKSLRFHRAQIGLFQNLLFISLSSGFGAHTSIASALFSGFKSRKRKNACI